MNKELLEILNNTKDWLKFAEAKNAMLIAFNAASIYGFAKLPFLNKLNGANFIDGYFSFVIILLIVSIVACLISFVPRLKFMSISIVSTNQKNNILFFQHLGQSTPRNILESLKNKGGISSFTNLDEDIAVQIHSLARVASSKYSLFAVAVWISVAAYITPVLAIIFALYTYKK